MPNPLASVTVGRIDVRGNQLLATVFDKKCDSRAKDSIEDYFASVLTEASATFSPLVREKKTSIEFAWFLMMDRSAELVYGVVCRDQDYAERHAFALIGEMIAVVQTAETKDKVMVSTLGSSGLKNYKKNFKELLDKYQTPAKFDKTADVQQKVDDVKGVMEDNVRKILDNNANLEDMQERSENLRNQANQFQRGAGDLRRQMWLRQLKLKILLGVVVLALVLYLVVPMIVYFTQKK
eukprot:Platyproteum_vivax@DN8658_c0_g1_i1.p1